ncbi:MAG: hypothetical protein AAF404_07480, partial [Pseudomonadota bacterium]
VQESHAQNQQRLIGEWGTEQQCAGELITARGSVRAAPFKIQADWISHGDVWCRLTWVRAGDTADGFIAEARALCGEDDLRDYRIDFTLTDNKLWLRWNLQIENGPLRQCL